jgi:hypothetical protein
MSNKTTESAAVTPVENKTFHMSISPPTDATKYKRPYPQVIVVPSRGYLYGGKFPGGEMIISPMTTQEEQILTSKKQDKVEVINMITKRCIVECPVPYEDLLLPDAFYTLLVIRNISLGSDYTFMLTCECGVKSKKTIDCPGSLEITGLTAADDCEPYSVTLPLCKKTVQYKLLRVKDETEIRRFSRGQYAKTLSVGEPAYCFRLGMYIHSVDGVVLDSVSKLEFVENLISRDSLTLRNAIEKREFGASVEINYECPACGRIDEQSMPFDREFFRPSDPGSDN